LRAILVLALLVGPALGLAVCLTLAPVSAQSPEEETEPYTPLNRRVESTDLAPVQLPADLWRGLDAAAIEKWLAAHDQPPRSPALHRLWRRVLLSTAPAGETGDDLLRVRLEALYRSGLLADIPEVLGRGGAAEPTLRLWRARVDIYSGAREQGCRALAGPVEAQLPKPLRAEKQLLLGYCAAVAGDTAGAALAASLAREEGSTAELALTVLESLDGGVERRPPLPGRLSLLDYRFLELAGPIDGGEALKKAEPALLAALAGSGALDIKVQFAAAEAALRLNALAPDAVAEVYRRLPGTPRRGPAASASDPALQRAQLFRAVEETQAPELRARLVRTFLDEGRRAGVPLQTACMLAPIFSSLWPTPDTGALAEAIVEVGLAADDLELARRWAETAANLQHWLALIAVAAPQADSEMRQAQQSGLAYLNDLAKRGRLTPAQLHRVVTVLDALDISVPLTLWEAAGRVAQPAGGYLPATGVLGDLAQASQQKEAGRTVLLAIEAMGPDGPEGANVLALGDTLRALKRAGLETDARRLALEALLPAWPRTSGG
jgi:hypothetical protein